jgi:glycosyltransferase A (GT-A) superfamily protein (DUF2064 family)
MKLIAACFAKTPGLTPAKTRLAKDIGSKKSEELYLLMINRCLELMDQLADFYPCIAVNEVEGLQSPVWKDRVTYLQTNGSLGEKLVQAEKFLFNHFPSILFWGTDSPSMTIHHFEEIRLALKSHPAAVIPAKDGGFTLYASQQRLPEGSWQLIRYSSTETLNDLIKYLPLETYFTKPMSDLDTIADIPSVIKEMNEVKSQGQAWDILKNFLEKI